LQEYSHQPIVDIAQLCAEHGIRRAVLSPGSRCAPLTIGFSSHPQIHCYTIPDERVAAYVAMGMAQAEGAPVALVCTSGTAAANYFPAMCEAFYQGVPLIAFTADRPAEWIGQQDGQAIQQNALYGQHVSRHFTLPDDYGHPDRSWHFFRLVNEALLSAKREGKPVQVNVPIREPFYPVNQQAVRFNEHVPMISEQRSMLRFSATQWDALLAKWPKSGKVLLLLGQQWHALDMDGLTRQGWPILADVLANGQNRKCLITGQDAFLPKATSQMGKALSPDLLISFGGSVISKALKIFLRKHKPKAHWHVQAHGEIADTFQSLTEIVRLSVPDFLERLCHSKLEVDAAFSSLWKSLERQALQRHRTFMGLPESFGEMMAVEHLLAKLDAQSDCLHLSNSMAVRYANYCAVGRELPKVYANRGTSGIDGCSSTAMGHAIVNPDKLHFLVTGDLAFFYDRNAFWHNYPKDRLRVLLINNHGGTIFNMIQGPANTAAHEAFFVTHQPLTARHAAKEHGFEYYEVNDINEWEEYFPQFLSREGAGRLLELKADQAANVALMRQYRQMMRADFAGS